jgi:putative pyruvate formate lyase activating enzyme
MHNTIKNIKFISCKGCPRECGANRFEEKLGFCNTGNLPLVASIFHHKGEEPIISGEKGICNVFFAHCNLSCVYCQNFQISRNDSFNKNWLQDYDEIVKRVTAILDNGVRHVGFVSPSHQVFQMIEIINRLNSIGYYPTIVYNTNCYEKPEIIRWIANYIDVYLPDIKYFSNELAEEFSGIHDYFEVAIAALKEMVWQKGTTISLGLDGLIDSGVIVRHLVLPNQWKDSMLIVNKLEDIFSNNLCISLLSQYYPTEVLGKNHCLKTFLREDEYQKVKDYLEKLGFYRAFTQKMSSNKCYRPDFENNSPF